MRTMIISRSSAAGMGKYGSTWLGDNSATVTDLEESVISIMDMNMFGIPLTGADICGFGGPENRNNTLCTRWHAVGTFYPFSRNHKECGGDPQEPWRFTDIYQGNTTYRDLMKVFIQRKYHLMRYIYTQMIMVSMGNSSTYYKPMFFEFPEDPNAFDDIANNVMLGPAIKTSVNARDLTSPTTDFYFPQGTWCSLFEPVGECITNKDAG
jgi:alpha-glucosidase (family GH31 glycosyl hydrolase)